MTLCEAIKRAKNYSGNINLQWFVCKWNDGYIIYSSTYMRRFPDTKFVYSTGKLRTWKVMYDEKQKRFKHLVK